MMRGYLRLVILNALSKKGMSGYGLIKYTYEQTGFIKPSSGSVYPLLKRMKKDGLLNVKKNGRKRIYSLTKKGRKSHTEILKKKKMFYNNILTKLKFTYHGDKFIELLDSLSKNINLIKGILPEGIKFRKNIVNLLVRKDLNKKDILTLRIILKKANKEVDELKDLKQRKIK